MPARSSPRLLRVALVAVLLVALAGPSPVCAQGPPSAEAPAERVRRAFADGDARRLLDPAAERVEVSLLGAHTFYSQSQALYVLRDFFETYAPERFALGDVTCAQAVCYALGRYWHARDDRPLSIYVRLAARDDAAWVLREVRVEEEPR
jgi:hypothetical protein